METEIWGMVGVKEHPKHAAQASLVLIDVTDGEASRGVGPEHVSTINVNRADGKTARFFVSVYVNGDGRAWGEITANKRETETRRRVAGVWLDYDERAKKARNGG